MILFLARMPLILAGFQRALRGPICPARREFDDFLRIKKATHRPADDRIATQQRNERDVPLSDKLQRSKLARGYPAL
jgi:hypothetical protein